MKRRRRKRTLHPGRLLIAVLCGAVLIAGAAGIIYGVAGLFAGSSDTDTAAETASASPTADPESDPRFSDPSSILICANKTHPLPEGYEPSDLVYVNVAQKYGTGRLREEAATAMTEMFSAAKQEGVTLMLGTAYRDENLQTELYNGYVAQSGQEYADTISSRPGYSEHQTGLCADIGGEDDETYLEQEFINTPAGQWLYNNAWKYGYILRYPEGKQDITGYTFEPWHYRYVGKDTAAAIHDAGENMTFEEFFGLSGGDYAAEEAS